MPGPTNGTTTSLLTRLKNTRNSKTREKHVTWFDGFAAPKLRETTMSTRESTHSATAAPNSHSNATGRLRPQSVGKITSTRPQTAPNSRSQTARLQYEHSIKTAQMEFDCTLQTEEATYNMVLNAAKETYAADLQKITSTHEQDRFTKDSAFATRCNAITDCKNTYQAVIVKSLFAFHTNVLIAKIEYILKTAAAKTISYAKIHPNLSPDEHLKKFLQETQILKFSEVDVLIEKIFVDAYAKINNEVHIKLNAEIINFLEKFNINIEMETSLIRTNIFQLIDTNTRMLINTLFEKNPLLHKFWIETAYTQHGLLYSTS